MGNDFGDPVIAQQTSPFLTSHQKQLGGPFKPFFGLSGVVAQAYADLVPWGLHRFHQSGQSHFVTFCCHHRRASFTTMTSCQTFEAALERVRQSFSLCIYGYVVMPEHVHLLLGEPKSGVLADALKSLKQGVSRRLIGDAGHFWQKRYYDFNLRDEQQFTEKLGYIHRNPVTRGFCARPEEWEWSSFCHYATGREGTVEIESEWTTRKRERAAGRLCAAVELPHSSPKKA